MNNLKIFIYGFSIEINGLNEVLFEKISKDFYCFVGKDKKNEKKLIINIFENENFVIPKGLIATKQTSNSIYYDHKKVRYNDYYGKAITVFNYQEEIVDIYTCDINFLHELVYLLILSRSTKFMDAKGFHKVHACGVNVNDKNILFMMPSKGGKSTMFLELIRDPNTCIISDDTPIIDIKGNIHTFPLRIGLENKNKIFSYLPYLRESDLYQFERQYFSKKYLVPLNVLKNKIKVSHRERNILIQGFRTTNSKPKLKKISKLKMFKHLIEHMIVGIGLPLILEYFLEHTLIDHVKNFKNLGSRCIAAINLLIKSDCYEFYLTQNPVENAIFLKEQLV